MSIDTQTYQRALTGAVIGLAAQVIVTLALLALAWATGSGAAAAATWHAGGGMLIWLLLAVVYMQHRMERAEALESEQLAQRHGSDSSIFDTAADDLAVARRRLERLVRWGLPVVSLVTAVYLIGVGIFQLVDYRTILSEPVTARQALPAWLLVFGISAIAFGCFIVSRYIAGMAKLQQWSLLRGGAGYLMGSFMVAATLAVGFVSLHFEFAGVLRYLTLIVPIFMIVIGAEISLNFVLDIYRPRKPGEMPRPAFDSRLLSLLTTPESIARTINEAINYQFGFEVSRSWFWQLLSRAFGWLIIMGALVLIVMSSIVIVQEHEQALFTRCGRLTSTEPIGPGLHLKLPWPLSVAHHYDVTRIRTIRAGGDNKLKENVAILWSNLHTEDTPVNLIVAPPPELGNISDNQEEQGTKTPQISLVNAEIDVHYRINNLMQYVFSSDEAMAPSDADYLARRDVTFVPDRLLKALAQREVARWLYTYDIDTLIGVSRQKGNSELRPRIQSAVDEAKLGVQIVAVNLKSVHPPGGGGEDTVADAFLKTVTALQMREVAIEKAKRERIQTLANVAGTVSRAQRIVDSIDKWYDLRDSGAPIEQVRQQELEIERELREAGGRAAQIINAAHADRWAQENIARGDALRFAKELLPFKESPQLYKTRAYLNVLTDGMTNARKYMLIGDRDELVLRFDLKDQSTGFEGLDLQADE